jgi:general secretion pathway protein L
MSLLVVQLPARLRLHPSMPVGAAVPTPNNTAVYGYVYSSNGILVDQGQCVAALLPKATSTVAVLAETDLSWHRITCPKAPASRLRAALAGMLEEQLMDEPESVHFALEPSARAGEPAWVAVTDRGWLADQIEHLERAGCVVDRVSPPMWPGEIPRGHFGQDYDSPSDAVLLTWAHSEGVASWPLKGGLSRALLPDRLPANSLFSANPAMAAAAERWLGQPVHIVSAAERLLKIAESRWNLRQFDMAPRHRTAAWLRDVSREFRSPAWRTTRQGLIGLALINLIGLNAWAWMLKEQVGAQRQKIVTLLQQAHPQVRAILDPAVQMRRENETLRAMAGKNGDTDLETLLTIAASAWPEQSSVQALRYDGHQLQLDAPTLAPVQIDHLRNTLRSAGWQIESTASGQITLRHGTGAAR